MAKLSIVSTGENSPCCSPPQIHDERQHRGFTRCGGLPYYSQWHLVDVQHFLEESTENCLCYSSLTVVSLEFRVLQGECAMRLSHPPLKG